MRFAQLAAVAAMLAVAAGQSGRVAAQKKDAPDPKVERQELLQTVGLLAASQVYQAYLNIGFLADGKASNIYQEKEAREILNSILSLLDRTDNQLDKVAKQELSQDDRDAIERVRKLSRLVRQQGDELKAFWATGDKERVAKYEALRKESWVGLSKILGLEK